MDEWIIGLMKLAFSNNPIIHYPINQDAYLTNSLEEDVR